MKVSSLPYYVKFIFSSSDGDCVSTADPDTLKFVKSAESGKPIYSVKTGDVLTFEPQDKRYKVTSVAVRQLASDTDDLKYGIDMDDCTETQGVRKEVLFSILVSMDPE